MLADAGMKVLPWLKVSLCHPPKLQTPGSTVLRTGSYNHSMGCEYQRRVGHLPPMGVLGSRNIFGWVCAGQFQKYSTFNHGPSDNELAQCHST